MISIIVSPVIRYFYMIWVNLVQMHTPQLTHMLWVIILADHSRYNGRYDAPLSVFNQVSGTLTNALLSQPFHGDQGVNTRSHKIVLRMDSAVFCHPLSMDPFTNMGLL